MQQNPDFFGTITPKDISEAWVLTTNPNITPIFEIQDVVISHKKGYDSAKILKIKL